MFHTDELGFLLSGKVTYPYRLFYINSGYYSYVVTSKDGKGKTLSTSSIDKSNIFIGFKPDRGKILDLFSHFEFITSQIVLAKLNPDINLNFLDNNLMQDWNMILDGISFEQKIKFIEDIIVNDFTGLKKDFLENLWLKKC